MTLAQHIRMELDQLTDRCYEAGRQFADTVLLSLPPPWTDAECISLASVLADQINVAFEGGCYQQEILEHFTATMTAGLYLRYWGFD